MDQASTAATDAAAADAATDADAGSKPDAGGVEGSATAGPKMFDETYVKTLRREAAAARTELGQTKTQLQELLDREKTDQERLSERVTASEARASEAETRALRYEIAAEKGLDITAAGFLSGTTRDEITATAEALASLLEEKAGAKSGGGGFDGGARERAAESRTPVEAHNDFLLRALGRTPNP
jgi:hypothetical protein